MQARRTERSASNIKANLLRVKSLTLPKEQPAISSASIPKPTIPTFKKFKAVRYVDNKEALDELVSVLCLSEPKWVGVDLEHSKRQAYHGMICLIQITWLV